jgi:flavin reductase
MDGAAAERPAISAAEFKAALRGLAASVCVITTRHGTVANGMTATAVCSVSADPPSMLIVVNQSNRSSALIRESGVFAVHVLSKDQEPLATHFASRPDDPFAGVPVRSGATAAPSIEGCETVLECVVETQTDFGTHTIFVGRVVAARHGVAEPLLYCHGRFGSLA